MSEKKPNRYKLPKMMADGIRGYHPRPPDAVRPPPPPAPPPPPEWSYRRNQ